MVTAPTVPNLQVDNFKVNDRRQAVIKDNSRNKKMELFATQLAKMCDELNIEFQYVEDTRIDITNKSGQVAADRQAVTAAKNAVNADRQHVDQQKQAIDTTAEQVSQNAQQVATDRGVVAQDKRAAANAAQAASSSAGDALTAKQQAEALYGDLDAVNTAKTQSQQSAQTATQQAGLAITARQAAESAQDAAETAAHDANVDVDAAVNAVVNNAPSALNTLKKLAAAINNNPSFHTALDNALAGKLSTSGGTLTGDLIIDKSGTGHLWFRENGAPRGLLYAQSFGNSFGTRLRTYLENGNVAADLGLKENGDIEAIVGRFKGDGSGLTGTAPIRAQGTTAADVGLGNVVNVVSPSADWISHVGLASNNLNSPYMRRKSDGVKVDLATSASLESHKTSGDHDGRYLRTDAGISIQVSGDWNDVITTGLFRGNGMSNACPGGHSWKYCIVQAHSGSYVTQLMVDYGGSGIYSRVLSSGTWSSWRGLLFSDDEGRNLTAVDAAKLNGSASSVDGNSNTIARRTGNGDLFARLFRSTYTGLNSDIAAIYTTRTVGGDWMRPSSPDQVKIAMGLNNVANVDQRNASNLTRGTIDFARVPSTTSRSSTSSNHALAASAMNAHRTSGDHDGRYINRGSTAVEELNDLRNSGGEKEPHTNRTLGYAGYRLAVGRLYAANNTAALALNNTGSSANNIAVLFNRGEAVGSIAVNSDGATYNTISDYRLKHKQKPLTEALGLIAKLPVYLYSWKNSEATEKSMGVLAHEAAQVVPEAVTGTKDGVEEVGMITLNGVVEATDVPVTYLSAQLVEKGAVWEATGTKPVYQQVDYSKLVPLLIASVQELTTELDTLKKINEAAQ